MADLFEFRTGRRLRDTEEARVSADAGVPDWVADESRGAWVVWQRLIDQAASEGPVVTQPSDLA